MPVIVEPDVETGPTLLELQEEFYLRGFTDMEAQTSRVKKWCNEACREIYDWANWPYLEAETEDTAPVEIERLSKVLAVVDMRTEVPLEYIDRRTVTGLLNPGVEATGSPSCWYREVEGNVCTFPLNTTDLIAVRIKVIPEELKEATDKTSVPRGYMDVVIDNMVARAYKNREAWSSYREARAVFKEGLEQMGNALLMANLDNSRLIQRTGYYGYLN